ncbi:hypothetical protein EUBSIR_02169 [[Eubacterium] siraeum DSM 15702]|uniref:Uncharacterized protein n=1 Tax=[Eubacterium] siraeum DSM 15702 TaxID=428128 RepID=B0MQQ2_9FIRM|nr:hypothetical protein EUBSIR_02169 [[Eubacterium] siraeum DSM 15702]
MYQMRFYYKNKLSRKQECLRLGLFIAFYDTPFCCPAVSRILKRRIRCGSQPPLT